MLTLLYSGNVGIGQDLATVLRAVASLDDPAAIRILIVGSGKGLPAVRKVQAHLALPNVEIRPPVPLDQLRDLLAGGDIHLVCQKPGTEGLLVPSKIYSTLAVGRPVLFVGPTACEVGRILREGACGYVVAPADVHAARDALQALIGSEALRASMGHSARAYYRRHFGRDRSVSHIIAVLEAVAEKG